MLQDVASSTLQLVAEFTALLEAGILERFPNTFPPGLLTWERWVWAAAVFSSRILPGTAYINSGDDGLDSFQPSDELEFQSPPEIWKELGVLLPLLDMLNHEAEENQVTWEACSNEDIEASHPHPPRAITHQKVKKGNEIFTCYGHLSNSKLLLSYGFAQMNNSADEVRLGWALTDAVGNVEHPYDFTPPFPTSPDNVYESHDEAATNAWWTDDRIKFVESQIGVAKLDSSFMPNLKAGKKISVMAYSDGAYHPVLLAAIVAGTMPANELGKYLSPDAGSVKVSISKRQQTTIQRYLRFFYVRKLEKLLQNLDNGLKAHFGNVNLWTKASDGGLNYQQKEGDSVMGWRTFFDANAYKASMEVENRYYAMGTDSCILALYDGQLRALQVSVEGASDDEKFASGVLLQLENLGYEVSTEGGDAPSDGHAESASIPSQNGSASKLSPKNRKKNKGKKSGSSSTATAAPTGDKPPAVKLHIGNLSYSTTPSDLYDYFSDIYGESNVLECHIPIERDTGRSRGFGFVAMPELVAQRALSSGRKHEVDGRVLKVARSNSAGSSSSARAPAGPPPVASDRCLTCGYRPKYCTCARPNVPGFVPPDVAGGPLMGPPPIARVLPPMDYGRGPRDYGPPPPDRYRDERRRDYYDDDRHRDYDRDRRRYEDDRRGGYDDDDYYRERSRRDRDRGRSYDREREKRSSRSRSTSRRRDYEERERSSSRRERSKGELDDYDRPRKRSRSRSREKSSSRKKKSKRRNRSRSRSRSPDPAV